MKVCGGEFPKGMPKMKVGGGEFLKGMPSLHHLVKGGLLSKDHNLLKKNIKSWWSACKPFRQRLHGLVGMA